MFVPLWFGLSKIVLRIFFGLRFGLEVRGQEHVPKRGPFIVACNHISFLDPPVIGTSCPRRLRFMARADLFGHPWLGTYLRAVGVMPVKRDEADLAAMRRALAFLERGEGVAIFPEGTRQVSGRLGAAKRGVGLLAEAARAPIVPALIQGSRDALPPDATKLGKAKIRVAFGPLIPYTIDAVPAIPDDAPPSTGLMRGRARHEQLAEAVTLAWRRLEHEQSAR